MPGIVPDINGTGRSVATQSRRHVVLNPESVGILSLIPQFNQIVRAFKTVQLAGHGFHMASLEILLICLVRSDP